ncbi:unnamed protein product [Polarella glacialis]|uniref:Glutathionylspermidine synthase pre-ATP-grasp-like domain-containing protein n=1 Tax=Polarella glacialis TaxID=89957 RepID=A0A813GK95_POLGL|nr:unnamed protein product [Polarella glacialis]
MSSLYKGPKDSSPTRSTAEAWTDLSWQAKLNWQTLGWSRTNWDADSFGAEMSPQSATASWDHLSPEQKEAAEALGYDEELWEEDEGEVWKGDSLATPWGALPDGRRQAWAELGWTEHVWGSSQEVGWMTTPWRRLGDQQREAAARLGYYEESWNKEFRKDYSSYLVYMPGIAGLLLVLLAGNGCYKTVSGRSMKTTLDQQEDQVSAVHLRRQHVRSRGNWRERCEELGFAFHSAHGINWGSGWFESLAVQDPYWCENGVYVFSAEAKRELDDASWELHNMCLEAVDQVVREPHLMELFQAVRDSWDARQPDLIGRFDLIYDGSGPPKLLEYNADTPTLLLESSLVQKQWWEDRRGDSEAVKGVSESCGQFNSLDESLVSAWPSFLRRSAKACGLRQDLTVHFAAQRATAEERCNVDYLASTARKAGISTETVEIEDLTLGPDGKLHVASAPGNVEALWKLYPYEWLAEEDLGSALEADSHCIWAEPPWKAIISNKSILALLWQMFPDHPNLLPAFFTIEEAQAYQLKECPVAEEWGWVAKPRYGREGVGIRYSFDAPSLESFAQKAVDDLQHLESFGHHGSYRPDLLKQTEQMVRKALGAGVQQNFLLPERHAEHLLRESHGDKINLRGELPFPPLGGPVFQLYQDTATFAGRRPVVGSWMVYGMPAGICVREDIQQTTDNDSCFTPHLVDQNAASGLQVTGVSPGLNVSGSYKLTGQMREHGVYWCQEKGMYLLQNAEGYWMFTPQEGGGHDHLQGVAVSQSTSSDPSKLSKDSWHVAEGVSGPSVTVTRTPPTQQLLEQRTLSDGQRALRTDLYGEAGSTTAGVLGASDVSTAGGGGGVHAGYGFWRRRQQQQAHQAHQAHQAQQQSTSKEDDKKKHGRKSAASMAWRQYGRGTTAKTGS